MTKQGDRLLLRQMLQQPKRVFLAGVLYSLIADIYTAGFQ